MIGREMIVFTPAPLRLRLSGLVPALLVMVNLPFLIPVFIGEKMTLILQLSPGANVSGLIGQLLVWA